MATLRIAAAMFLSCLAAAAQSPAPPVATLQVDTQLIVVDVVVQDRNGNPIHGLKPENFKITEAKSPQSIRHFEEHISASAQPAGPAMPKLPPGSFTDYTPVVPNGTLNILLLDALNTPIKDQPFVRLQLQEYVRHADPGTRIAIFALGNRLNLLQGFTSDPSTLKDIIDHKLIPRPSSLLDGSTSDTESPFDPTAPGMAEMSANLQQFEAQQQSLQIRLRSQFTLDAFNSLAHYLAGFPGRKNLIWFSGAFPFNILPDPSLTNPFALSQLDPEEFRETTNLLAKAQVAVYPVDARGLMTQPMLDASKSGQKYVHNPGAFATDSLKFSASQAAEHDTMDRMADDTGGHAFYNTNGLADAVAKAINSGSNYYTLTYSPTAHVHDGSYRDIHIQLTPDAASGNPKLLYRQGYYADLAKSPKQTATATPAPPTSNGYAHAAMSRGAPTPQDILFKVRVLPTSTETETTLAPGNTTDPITPIKPPFQRLAIDYIALPGDFTLTPAANDRHTGEIEFMVYLFDVDGRLLNADGRSYKLNLDPRVYKEFLAGPLRAHLELSVPTRTETYLRIGIHDIPSNRFGVVEFPTSTVSHLPPAAKLAPSPSPATTPPAHTVPSTPAAPPQPPPS